MVSYKNGYLKFNSNREKSSVQTVKIIFEILFVANPIVLYLFASVKLVAPFFTIALMLSSFFIVIFNQKTKITIPFNSIWYAFVILYCALSTLWATYYQSNVSGHLFKMSIILVLITSISIYVETEDDLERLMNLFVLSVTFIVLYEFAITPVENWTTGWLGGNVSGNNSNSISFWAACAGAMVFYNAYIKEKRLYYILFALFLVFCVLSSSRKALLIIIISSIILVLLSSYKRNYGLRIFLFILLSFIVFYAIFTNDTLYDIIGVRFDHMFGYMLQGESPDTSIHFRIYFASVAKDLFSTSPIIGHGFENYTWLLGETSSEEYFSFGGTYAHNNYWQILSELGIIGLIIYYSFYIFIFFKLIKRVFVERNRLSYLFLTFIFIIAVFDVGIVSITSKHTHIILALTYTATYATNYKQITYK